MQKTISFPVTQGQASPVIVNPSPFVCFVQTRGFDSRRLARWFVSIARELHAWARIFSLTAVLLRLLGSISE